MKSNIDKKIRFYIARLKNTSIHEIAYRSREIFLILRLKKSNYAVHPPPVVQEDCERLELPVLNRFIKQQEIPSLLNINIFPLNEQNFHIRQFENEARNIFFSSVHTLRHPIDIRSVWEPARLQHVTLALSYLRDSESLSPENNLEQLARDTISEWIKNNPFFHGPHYISVMECALRIPVFFYYLRISREIKKQECTIILNNIWFHAWWIEKRLSLYSSLGNHTVCECMGLVFAGAVFRELADGKRWLERGTALLGQELNHQILPDGGPVEQSLNYHRFVLDLYWLVVDFLESNGLFDCEVWKSRLFKGEEFIAAFQDENGILPSIGDSDDGHAVAPMITPKRGVPAGKVENCVTFPDAGYTVIRAQSSSILLTFDHGPLGMAPLYNHGHADALSVTLSMNGVPMLVDPGTYRYNGVPEWREYFKGTRAHNTVTIDGQDQSVQETGFIWSHPYICKLLRNENESGEIMLEAGHDGYNRLEVPVLHRRLIHITDNRILIRDMFSGKGTHKYELNYHLHPDCKISKDGKWFKVAGKKGNLFLRLIGDGQFNMVSGQENPPFGWYSPAYNVKLKSPVLSYLQEGTPDKVTFMTAICTGKAVADDSLEVIADRL